MFKPDKMYTNPGFLDVNMKVISSRETPQGDWCLTVWYYHTLYKFFYDCTDEVIVKKEDLWKWSEV